MATDDEQLVDSLRDTIEGTRIDATTSTDAEILFQEIAERLPQALLIDNRFIPEITPRLCRRLRTSRVTADLPIIVITAPEASTARIRALESGADDCVNIPLNVPELVARIRAKSRQSLPPEPLGHLHAGPIDLDLDRWTATAGDEPLSLTKKEFLLLQTLIESRGRTLTREYLLQTVWRRGK